MGSLLCITSGLTGILFSSLELARRLSAAGHELTYASFSEVRQTVEDHGFRFLQLAPSRYQEFLRADAESSAFERLRNLDRRRQQATDAMAVGDLADAIRTVDPDLLLIDGEMHEHIIAVWATGVPIVLLNTFASIWQRPGLPPPHHFVQPGTGWKGSRIGTWLLWRNLRLRKIRTAWVQRARHMGCDRLSILRRLAGEVGFELAAEADFNQWPIPFTYRHLPVLSLHALEFEFPHEPPGRVHYLGPMIAEDRIDRGIAKEVRAELETLFDRRRNSSGRRKLIYAGFGSFFTTDLALLKRLIQAVAPREDWDLVISLGNRFAAGDLGELPENVRAFPWLPQTTVLKHADVVVNHGGINSIDESVVFGVPSLVFCGFETDMGGNSARVAYHEIGIVGSRSSDSPEAIRRHLDRLLTESRFQDNVERLRSCYLAYADNRVAERVVEALLEGPPRARSGPTA